MDIFAQQSVRADHDVDSAFGKVSDNFFVLLRAAEATDHINNDWVFGHALAKGVEVLLAKHGGWHQQGDLFAREHGFECSTDCDFGFAKAHVTANQTVHRQCCLHVRFGGFDGSELIGCFGEREGPFEGRLPRVIWRKGVAAVLTALGVQGE